MIFMIGGIIVGILLGILVVRFVPKNVLGWVVVGLGAVALAFIIPGLVAILIPGDAMFSPAFSIPLGVGCVVSGIGAVRKNYRPLASLAWTRTRHNSDFVLDRVRHR